MWLKELGYSTCFFVAGGNSMHLLNSFRNTFSCVPVVHEVTAVIAAEYFNQHSAESRALALLTAGPGLTNSVTGIAGAWLESRPVLVIGGQVKTSDLTSNDLRQRGIQEIGGAHIVKSITKASVTLRQPISKENFFNLVRQTDGSRPGPVFIEVCLDVQAAPVSSSQASAMNIPSSSANLEPDQLDRIKSLIRRSKRPVLLLGGGLPRSWSQRNQHRLDSLGIPIQLTWNGADRYASDRAMWFGRPDTWGMRFANLILQQADLVVVVGARLGLQQTGFNWRQFVPGGDIVHVCNDEAELQKGHPATTEKVLADAVDFLEWFIPSVTSSFNDWISYCCEIKDLVPLSEESNSRHLGFHNPYDFVIQLSQIASDTDRIVPCSSGGANTVMMQAFQNKTGQIFFNDRALASMGYGLAGAIGAALSVPKRRTILVEGDGGFAQNLQDLGTVSNNKLNLKMFILENEGYASIRMTQRNYFGGAYVGCDTSTGLGFPDWAQLARAYGIDSFVVPLDFGANHKFMDHWNSSAPVLFRVPVHPEQTYYPKITSRLASNGSMESAALHQMSPELSRDLTNQVTRFIP